MGEIDSPKCVFECNADYDVDEENHTCQMKIMQDYFTSIVVMTAGIISVPAVSVLLYYLLCVKGNIMSNLPIQSLADKPQVTDLKIDVTKLEDSKTGPLDANISNLENT